MVSFIPAPDASQAIANFFLSVSGSSNVRNSQMSPAFNFNDNMDTAVNLTRKASLSVFVGRTMKVDILKWLHSFGRNTKRH
jgi:hypothetical protein